MNTDLFDAGPIDIAWCPGCGNFSILKSLKLALSELMIEPKNMVIVSGIGQAAKIPHYLKTNFFNGLHGRALPAATAIKAVNPLLTVICESGDGDMYGEGGNHFIHAIRRNPDITNIVHNNMVYGLTKGQASPTSLPGFHTPVQVHGVCVEPFNPLAVAVSLDASFVARAFSGDIEQTKEILKKAISHKGYALVDIFQPCVSFNKLNTYEWYKQNIVYIDESHDPRNKLEALKLALKTDKYSMGILYINPDKSVFTERCIAYRKDEKPLYQYKPDLKKLQELIDSRTY